VPSGRQDRKAEPTRPTDAPESEPDPRERLLKSDLSFEELTWMILKKKPSGGGWKEGEKKGEV
jgi:hypothetical protein